MGRFAAFLPAVAFAFSAAAQAPLRPSRVALVIGNEPWELDKYSVR